MPSLRSYSALFFGTCVTALTSLDVTPLNLTTTVSSTIQATQTEHLNPAPLTTNCGDWTHVPGCSASEKPSGNVTESTQATPVDVRTVLEDWLTSILPTIHLEVSATGWGDDARPTSMPRKATSTPRQGTLTSESATSILSASTARNVASTTNDDASETINVASTTTSIASTPRITTFTLGGAASPSDSGTLSSLGLESDHNDQGSSTRPPSRQSPEPQNTKALGTVNTPKVTVLPIVTYTGVNIRPVPATITYKGVTLRPVPTTSTAIVTIGGGFDTPSIVVDVQYVAGSSTLALGTPVTIKDAVIELTTNSVGATVLIAGGTVTTLPAPTPPNVQEAKSSDNTEPITVMPTVVDGTTKYVFAGRTLAPDHPVTINDIPISIATSGGSTILAMGNLTTTFVGVQATNSATRSATVTANTFVKTSSNRVSAQQPTSTRSDARKTSGLNKPLSGVAVILAMLLTIR